MVAACNRLGPCYVAETPRPAEDVPPGPPSPVKQVRYFFDRTESMQGFTQNDQFKVDAIGRMVVPGHVEESTYTKAIESVWTVGGQLWASQAESLYYEFGGLVICEIPFSPVVLNELRKPQFYGYNKYSYGPGTNRQVVYSVKNSDGEGQPFGSVADYIRDSVYTAPEITQNCLNIVITDLYENNKAHLYFHQLFQDAFERGMSGAIFAVTSSFNGNINDVSGSNNQKNIPVKNGSSTFFIFIVGDTGSVQAYSEGLARDFEIKGMMKGTDFELSLFINDALYQGKPYLLLPSGQEFTRRETVFNSGDYKYKKVNLRKTTLLSWAERDTPPKSGEDEERSVKYVLQRSDAEAYLTIGDSGSRYIAALPVEKGDITEFEYSVDVRVEYFDGGKNTRGEPSAFEPYARPVGTIVTAAVDVAPDELEASVDAEVGTDYLYLLIETKNKNLIQGYYKIGYTVRSHGKIPAWVYDRSASDIEELEASVAAGGQIKVLHLTTIYGYIKEAFNKIRNANNEVYSGVLYLVRKN
jgi:hypothetical protein